MSSSAHDIAASPAPSRPLRTLNNIHSAPHVIQLHPERSPNLSGKRKTAVELLAESKASFYVDRKPHQPESLGGSGSMLQHHPNRSPMLQPSHLSVRIREHHALPAVVVPVSDSPASIGVPNSNIRTGNSRYTTPPVEKRRLSIRKSDNPLPTLNVTAVKRFLSRPNAAAAEMHGVEVRKVGSSKSVLGGGNGGGSSGNGGNKGTGFFGHQPAATPLPSGNGERISPTNTVKKASKPRIITFSGVLPCICQSNQPPELPHRMSRNNPSPPPPIPPKSPALNAKLKLLSQQQQQLEQLKIAGGNNNKTPPIPPSKPTHPVASESQLFRCIQRDEEPTNFMTSTLPVAKSHSHQPDESRTSTRIMTTTTSSLLRHHGVLHKSLPDLNSPKNARRNGRHGCPNGGKIRSASTDLDSCESGSSCGSSSRMSRSSSVHLGSASSSDDESSANEDEPHCFRRPGGTGPTTLSRSERATTSDYASRSPSFKYETASLVQTSQTCWTLPPPWLDDKDPTPADNDPFTDSGVPVTTNTTSAVGADQVNRRRAFILRSKSDVGPSRFAPDLLPAVPPEFTGDVPHDLDYFFDTIGNVHQHHMDSAISLEPSEGRSSPVYFSSVSSVDSNCRRVVRQADNTYESSDSEDLAATLQRRLLGSQPGMGEPSIIERNARIIKWLIKCRNVPTSSIPTSGSTGQLAKLASLSVAPPIQPPPVTAPRTNNNPPQQQQLQSGSKSTTGPYYGQSTRL